MHKLNPQTKAYVMGACQAFLHALIEKDAYLPTREEIFTILAQEAGKKGYTLEAHQRGIQGTFICFRKA